MQQSTWARQFSDSANPRSGNEVNVDDGPNPGAGPKATGPGRGPRGARLGMKTAIAEKYIGVGKMKNGHIKGLPAGLTPEARALFEQTVRIYGIDDPPSLTLLLNAALALVRLRAAEAVVAKEGSTFRDRFNQVKSHPACARIDAENGTIARNLRELGLDLSSMPASGRIPEGI